MAEKTPGKKTSARKTGARTTAARRTRATAPEPAPRPVAKLYQVYLYTIALVTVLILVFSGARAVYGLVRVVVPGETAKQGPGFDMPFWSYTIGDETEVVFPDPGERLRSAERRRGLAELGGGGIFAGIALLAFRLHWRRAGRLRVTFEAPER